MLEKDTPITTSLEVQFFLVGICGMEETDAWQNPIGEHQAQQDRRKRHCHWDGQDTAGLCRDTMGVDGHGGCAAGVDGLISGHNHGVYVSVAHAGHQVLEFGDHVCAGQKHKGAYRGD